MKVTVETVGVDEKPLLGALIKAGKHRENEPDYAFPHFDDYWTSPERSPYFIHADGDCAGFVLLDKYFWILPKAETNYGVAEIYVKPAFRRQGVGRAGMFALFDTHPGNWEIRPLDGSADAQGFWERTIGAYTRGNYRTTCFGKYRRPIYTLQVPTVAETGHEIIYREPYMGF